MVTLTKNQVQKLLDTLEMCSRFVKNENEIINNPNICANVVSTTYTNEEEKPIKKADAILIKAQKEFNKIVENTERIRETEQCCNKIQECLQALRVLDNF